MRRLFLLPTLLFLAGCPSKKEDDPEPTPTPEPTPVPLSVSAVSPNGGPSSGGTPLTITGDGFLAGATVTVGGSACGSATVVSLQQLTCVSPAGALGTADVVVTLSDARNATLASAFTWDPSTWAIVDGDLSTGLNQDTTRNASASYLATLGTSLYVVWTETNGTADQIRAKVFNGNPDAPSWASVDGAGVNGLNVSATEAAALGPPVVFDGELYVIWRETNGGVGRIFVKVYNGNDAAPSWAFAAGAAGSINVDPAREAVEPLLAVDNGKLYAVWAESNGSANRIRVKVFNPGGGTWDVVDGGGLNLSASPAVPGFFQGIASFGGALYVSWEEPAVGGQALRVKRYNGNDSAPVWTLMDGGSLNSGAGVFPSYPKLLSTDAGLFLVWHEGTPHQVRVRRFNEDTTNPSWPFVDGGATNIAFSSLEEAEFPQGTSQNGRLYVAWSETTSTVRQIHVKSFDGNESSPGWTFLDGGDGTGINRTTATGLAPHLVSTPTGIYATWVEYYIAVPQVRVARGT